MDLTQIRYFLALSTTLNFTRAAEACNVTQPALTKSIQRLEDELGGPLLLRERSHTQLTPLGETMLPLLQRTLDAADAARLSARRFRTQDTARLRIGLGDWVHPGTIIPLVTELTRRFPTLELTLRHGGIPALNDWLLRSEIDVSLTAGAGGLTDRANRWTIFADQLVAHIPTAHPLAMADPLTLDHLRPHALATRTEWGPDGEPAAPESPWPGAPPPRHHCASDEQVDALVQSGIAIAITTTRRKLPHGVIRRPIAPAMTIDIVAAAIAGRAISRPADAFLRLARARSWDGSEGELLEARPG